VGSMQEAEAFFDERLEAQLEYIHASLGLALRQPGVQTPLKIVPSLSLHRPLPLNYHIEFQVFHPVNGLVARSEDFPVQALVVWQEGFSEFEYEGVRWRGRIHWDEPLGLWYLVAERFDQRYSLAESVIVRAILPLLLVIPLLALAIWAIVTYALGPLKSLTQALSQKSVRDFSPLPRPRLPRELVPLVNAINGLLERLAQAFAREQRFSADAAHELRTPLAALKVHAANLYASLKALGEQSQALELAERVQVSADRMGHLIQQILTLNRAADGAWSEHFKPTELLTLSRQLCADYYPLADAKRQTLEIAAEGEFIVLGDPWALSILLSNLISNAIKYTPEGGQIRLNLELQAHKVAWILEDSGPGIAVELRERVYDRFYRVGGDRHASDTLGCGLGLSIAQQIVQLHGGSMAMSTSSLGGLAVTLMLPTPQ
ncbi:MAG TPA: ATP-binding protein, partial [Marinagarivorans sp.]|nr:ATP-binding protein [Marinagarivorans sp.]